ncbi:hypothetical protein GW17_00045030 [Ensete ventricosum]|nr:hypothetical protein GW17_00045030 [Ensete ventricosum]
MVSEPLAQSKLSSHCQIAANPHCARLRATGPLSLCSTACHRPFVTVPGCMPQALPPFCKATIVGRLINPQPLFPDKNRASLSYLSPALFSFEDLKIRVPLYTGVHIAGLAALSLNLVGTCYCHR